MRLLADESVDRQIVDRLRLDGNAVQYVAEMDPGIGDEVVLQLANQEADVLLTSDKDFGELVYRQGRVSAGIMLLRLAGLSPAKKAQVVATAVSRHGAELPGAFAVLTAAAFRVRRLR